MTYDEIAIWSACLGIYASYSCLMLFYAAYRRSKLDLHTAILAVVCASFLMFSSGWAQHFLDLKDEANRIFVMISGPLSAAYAALGLRNFLRAEQRDSVVDKGMLFVVILCAFLLLAVAWPERQQGMEVMGVGLLAASTISFWLTLRSWLLGDRFAMPMTIACIALVFAVGGCVGMSLGVISHNIELQALAALMAAIFIVLICHTMRRRLTNYSRMSQALSMSKEKDLLTQLWTGSALIQKVDEAIARAGRNRKEMAVICVEIYNSAHLRKEHGNHGMEQVIYGMAARIRQACGSVPVVGRYGDTGFVIVLDSVKQPGMLRTVGLRVASSVRRPYVLNNFSSTPREFRGDMGLGITRVVPGRKARLHNADTSIAGGFDSFALVQDVMHEATELALAAKAFNSRAAILDAHSGKSVALEAAKFD